MVISISSILRYVINMTPYMLITVPVYLIARIVFVKAKKTKTNLYHEIVLFAFVIFIVGLASQTIIPKFEVDINGFHLVKNGIHQTNLIPLKVLFETYSEVFVNGNINYFFIYFLGNIIMFIPFGLFIPLLWTISNKKTLIIGFCSSLFIEIFQLFLSRRTDVDDLILNTTGVLLGVLIYKFLQKHLKSFVEKFKIVRNK